MRDWEYKVIASEATGHWFSMGGEIDVAKTEAALNVAGRDGWELVSAFDTNQGHGASRNYVFLFKRPRGE